MKMDHERTILLCFTRAQLGCGPSLSVLLFMVPFQVCWAVSFWFMFIFPILGYIILPP